MRRPKPSIIGFEGITFLSNPTLCDALPAAPVPFVI
jgi:hypothetical protein